MFVFREGRRVVCARPLLDSLVAGLKAHASPPVPGNLTLDLLLRAGELECALADAGSPHLSRMAKVTDNLASALVCGRSLHVPLLVQSLEPLELPDTVSISPAEGFAYYALHPLNFSDMVLRRALQPAPLA